MQRRLLTLGLVMAIAGFSGMLVTAGVSGDGWWVAHHAGMMGWSASVAAPDTVPGAPAVEVEAFEFGFEPNVVEIPAGDVVNLSLVNAGALYHDLSIPELGFVLGAQPGQSAAGSLGDLAPGEYRFLCSVPGHAEAGMVGTLVVGP